ncbi:MAG: ATP-binding protein [Solirubrobacteraceae bacterium]
MSTVSTRIANRLRGRAGTLSHQVALAVAIVVAPVLVALVVVGRLMIVSEQDAILLGAIVLAAGLVAVLSARLLARAIILDVHAVRDGLSAVGRGERDVRIQTTADDELAELAAETNGMIERLQAEELARAQSELARRNLIAAVSHDLRTPMTSLRLLVQAVEDDVVQGETRDSYLRRMRIHLDALSSLVDDLFEVSRLEAGDISWSLEQVRLAELVDETVDAMRLQAEHKGVAVHVEVAPTLRPAHANPERVQRVLFNLIQNAIRHTPADGSVVVRAERVADQIEVEVADSGSGIAPEEREHVFAPFYRGRHDTGRSEPGAGLGLAVARAIIEAHGGKIWLADTDADTDADTIAGTRVRFSLPLAA